MIFPYADSLSRGVLFPAIWALLAAFTVVDVPMFLDPALMRWGVAHLGFFPVLFSVAPWANSYTLFTATLVHGGIVHLLGNALFLWAFGRSLERLFGATILLPGFFLLGVSGLLVHWALFPNATSPVIGASGAIAVLMGAYLALFPSAKMRIIVYLGIAYKRFTLPAWTFLLYWGGLQLISLALGESATDGVAYAVHVGGFMVGAIGAIMWKVSYPFAEERLLEFIRDSLSPTAL